MVSSSGIDGSGVRESLGLSHQALVYRNDVGYLNTIVPFVRDGIAAGEPVAVALPGVRLAAVRRALGTADATAVDLVDMAEVARNPTGIIGGLLRPFADGYTGHVRLVGEPIWSDRTSTEYLAALEHEALINDAFDGRRATILCPYDATTLAPSIIADAAATHPELIDEHGPHASGTYVPAGVVAGCNRPLTPPPDVPAFGFDLHTLAEARRYATAHAECYGIARHRLEDVAVVVGELTANSVQHGGGSGTLRVWREQDPEDGDSVVCQVDDAGRHTDPLAGRVPPPPDRLGGRGLFLVNRLSDLVRTHRGSDHTATRVWFR
ncbi:anti-sigma factor RsbA family regulatory protein [Prauserella rugosa]|uniref:Anti-sigma regulatory factor (Ser/Thr protein kinase) n=1 Tax=Prauserella rugosa TaxID=43354 RepID=A0A660C9A2_9PSEU|nr:anti-sigma factor RsbA family regulatory protein [Prauserella rugosa]TWH20138.1 anti-sigma regulatory factor (Ser/Thr protein kinase) [Prauserella rugosa]